MAAVVTEEGERLACRTVVTACDPRLALLELLDPPLSGPAAAELAATRRGNVVQALVHVATDRLPPYPHARAGDWNGLQSFVDHLDDLVTAWAASEAGLLPDPLPSTPLRPPPSTTRWPRPATTPCTWPARPPPPGPAEVGMPCATASSTTPSTPSRPGLRDSKRRSKGWRPGRPGTCSPLSVGRAPIPCTSTSPWISSASSAPPHGWPATAPRSRTCTSRAPGPHRREASPELPGARLPGPCSRTTDAASGAQLSPSELTHYGLVMKAPSRPTLGLEEGAR